MQQILIFIFHFLKSICPENFPNIKISNNQIISPLQKINKQTKQEQEYTSIPNIPLFTILDLYVQY